MKNYSELLQLDDAALAQEGWQRNAHGGITRVTALETIKRVAKYELPQKNLDTSGVGRACCGKRIITTGVVSLAKALISGRASPAVAAKRLAICEACRITDPDGTRLYRVIDDKAYCGVPRLADVTKIFRDEREEGCGCELRDKVQWRKVSCPNSRWGAEEAVEP